MTWFKVDDKLHDHRKARAAGATAMGVWCLAGSWAADNLTDGFIPATILPRWGRPRDANRLVDVGLWFADTQDGEKGWRFHEWHERQPSRAQKLEERAQKAEAGRIGGLRSGQSRREAQAKQSASLPVEPPTRPDPTRPKEPLSPKGEDTDSSDGFEAWWDTYAYKEGRANAVKAYKRALKKTDAETLLRSAQTYIAGQRRKGKHPEFTKLPTTWLNGEHWNDETTTAPSPVRSLHASELITPPDGMDAATYNQWLMATNPKHRAAQERQGVTFTPDMIPGWSA